jgi:hypothetical protein
MSIANPATISINAVPYSLAKINQDSYGSEYLYSGTTFELRLKIRHSKESPKGTSPGLDRHNVELTQTVYATSTTAEIVRQAYCVLRNLYSDDKTASSYLDQGLVDYLTDSNLGDLINWVN